MARPSSSFTATFVAITVLLSSIAHHSSSAFTQTGSTHKRHLHSSDVDEITSLLLHHRDDPLARHDKWSLLSNAQRLKWTSANNLFGPRHNFEPLLQTTRTLRHSSIRVHIDVQIVAPPELLSPHQRSLISRYSTAMRAGCNGTLLSFTVSPASEKVYNIVSLHAYRPHNARTTAKLDHLAAYLDQSALSHHSLNVLYVIVHSNQTTPSTLPSSAPILGKSRTAYFDYSVSPSSFLSITNLLSTIEHVAERVFAPNPMYFPIPLLPELEVSVIAYTPGHKLRAAWLDDFAWDGFETAVRSFAFPGQKVRFSSAQTNVECPDCQSAFQNADRHSAINIRQFILSLSGGVMPNHTWPNIPVAHFHNGHKQTTHNTFRLFVLDTCNLRNNEALQRLERRALFTFPGAAVLVIRSSNQHSKSSLHSLMLQAFIASVHGVVDPAFYSKSSALSRMSPLLRDSTSRNIVRSVVEKRLTELEEIMDGMLYFKVDPKLALDKVQLTQLTQRVNLLIFKLQTAQRTISNSNDGQLAIYLASSTEYDIKSIRSVFDIDDEKRVLNRFRDPTIRCHFSRLKRRAISASKIIETTYPTARPWLLSLSFFFTSAGLTRIILGRLSVQKSARKIE